MRITISYEEGEGLDLIKRREEMELNEKQTVKNLKALVQEKFEIRPNIIPCVDNESPSKSVLTLEYAGAVLEDNWKLFDMNIEYAATIRARVVEVCQQFFHRTKIY